MAPPRLLWLALALAACSPSEESARDQAEQALARGERGAAIAAIEQLRNASAETPEAYLEQAALWVRAGEARRRWMIDAGVARITDSNDLRLLQASTLCMGYPRAQNADRQVDSEARTDAHPAALLLRRDKVSRDLAPARDLRGRRGPAYRTAPSSHPRVAARLEERRFVEAARALDRRRRLRGRAPRAL